MVAFFVFCGQRQFVHSRTKDADRQGVNRRDSTNRHPPSALPPSLMVVPRLPPALVRNPDRSEGTRPEDRPGNRKGTRELLVVRRSVSLRAVLRTH